MLKAEVNKYMGSYLSDQMMMMMIMIIIIIKILLLLIINRY